MLTEIVPLIRLPRHLSVFDYLVPEKLVNKVKIGQIVEVPFRNESIQGVVLKIKKETPARFKNRLKEMSQIIDPIPYLSHRHLEFLEWMSEYYFVSLNLMMRSFVPDVPKRESKVKVKIPQGCYKDNYSKTCYSFNNLDQFKKIIKKGQQILILVPEIAQIWPLYEELGAKLGEIAIIHSELAKVVFYRELMKIRNDQVKIIIGTRLAIFAPIQNLGLMVVEKEHDSNYKQEEPNPRYHIRTCAIKLSRLFNCPLVLSSPTPSLGSYYLNKISQDKLVVLNQPKIKRPKLIKLIDMREEFRRKNFLSVSEQLQKEIKQILKTDKKILLFLNRRGFSSMSVCGDCGYSFNCPNCELPLTVHEVESKKSTELTCHHCHHQEMVPLRCPKCLGIHIKFMGRGIQKVESEIRELFPETSLVRIDMDSESQKSAEQKKYSPKEKIIIGTKLALKNLDWSEIGLVGIISADTLLHLPDFKSQEKTYQLLVEIIFQLSIPELSSEASGFSSGTIIIQTFNPQNYAILAASEMRGDDFYRQELKERKLLHYPPYFQLVKLIYKTKNEKRGKDETKRLFRAFLKQKEKFKNLEVMSPSPSYRTKIRGYFRWHLVLKLPANDGDQFKELLKIVSPDWFVDIDPESII